MNDKILIVEDQFIESDYLRLMLVTAGYQVLGIARSVARAEEMLAAERADLVLIDIFLKGKENGIDLARRLAEKNIPFVYLSANSNEEILNAAKATQPYGFLVKPFRERDLLVTLEIARYRSTHSRDQLYNQENSIKKELKKIAGDPGDNTMKYLQVGQLLQPYFPFDYLDISVSAEAGSPALYLGMLRTGFNEYQQTGVPELKMITGKKLPEITLAIRHSDDAEVCFYNDDAFEKTRADHAFSALIADTFEVKSKLVIPLLLNDSREINLAVYSRRTPAYSNDHAYLAEHILTELRKCLEKILPGPQGTTENKPVPAGSKYLADHSTTPDGFEGIIGKSHLLLNVFDHVIQVAGSATSVLLLGESGTGKEKIADSIHRLSGRTDGPFVKINCATLPANLIESELFGHERGAFTGATDKRIGKFEKADGGTIFLDEVGEMALELQVKLLRVLQEKEIERIGGKETIRVNVRVIAATNKNLEKEVAEGRFRLDLYYRLNVFPITLPSLRDRKDDIPALAYYFMDLYNQKAGRKISGISENVLGRMMDYSWPGNIRELEHMIERSVLLAKGSTIENILLPLASHPSDESGIPLKQMKTIHENERDYIIAVLKRCNGRIWGAGAAAEILNIPPTTLKSKMQKLGIKKEYIG